MGASARGWEMIRVVSVLVGLVTIATALRIAARLKTRIAFGMDDYLCFVALVFLYGMLIELILWCTIGGNGIHISEVAQDPATLANFSKIFLANQFTYFILSPAIKMSIICFYRRIFSIAKFMTLTFWLNCLISAWGTGIFLACALQCRPLKGYWDKSINAKCFDGNQFFIVNQVFNVVMDFIILGLPLPIIWSLKRVWQDKLALSAVFALGGFVCFASVYRIVVLFFIDDHDPTYTVYQATLWTHVEPSVGMICACLPIIRGLFPTFRFSAGRTRPTNSQSLPRYGNSSQHISSHSSHNSTYLKMNDAVAYGNGTGNESDEDRLVRDLQREKDGIALDVITVRTDIRVEMV